jgi:hypothetical protein
LQERKPNAIFNIIAINPSSNILLDALKGPLSFVHVAEHIDQIDIKSILRQSSKSSFAVMNCDFPIHTVLCSGRVFQEKTAQLHIVMIIGKRMKSHHETKMKKINLVTL